MWKKLTTYYSHLFIAFLRSIFAGLPSLWQISCVQKLTCELLRKLYFPRGLINACFPPGEFVRANGENKSNLIGWRQTLTSSPPNHIHLLLIRAKKSAKRKTDLKSAESYQWERTGARRKWSRNNAEDERSSRTCQSHSAPWTPRIGRHW